jgi:hypothetical protein
VMVCGTLRLKPNESGVLSLQPSTILRLGER